VNKVLLVFCINVLLESEDEQCAAGCGADVFLEGYCTKRGENESENKSLCFHN